VINAIRWLPHRGVVAIGTVVRGRYVRRRFANRLHAVVATDTSSQHLRVIYPEKRCPERGRVAILADIGRLHVRRTLAGSVEAVVTGKAIARDIAVVEHGRDPGCARMTIVAAVAGGDVIRCLPCCLEAVVTATATACHRRMIHKGDGTPGSCRVAIVANRRRSHVINWLRRRANSADSRMATGAGRTRSVEYSTGVAPVAAHVRMSAIEFKACAEVIEGVLHLRRSDDCGADQHRQNE